MKKYVVISTVLATAILVAGLAGCSSDKVNANTIGNTPAGNTQLSIIDNSSTTGIWVNGVGKVTVTPDIAILNLGLSDKQPTVAAAQANTTEAMNKILAALKQAGIADKDIQTTSYSIQQVTKWDNYKNESTIDGYMVSNMVSVKIRALDKVGDIIDAVSNAGGDSTRVNGISLTVDNPEGYYGEARGKAMADAKAKADQLASLAGIKLGAATYVTESTGYYPIQMPVMRDAAGGATSGVSVPISAGETEITLNVQVAFAIAQ